MTLANADVRWEGTHLGLSPTIAGEAADRVRRQGESAVPRLVDALEDPDRFVAAHVLLTEISGVEHQAFPSWNGLAVDLAADGTVTIDPAQRHDLARRWRAWQAASPRPRALPPGG